MSKNEKTSKKIASIASKVLRNSRTSKKIKSVAADGGIKNIGQLNTSSGFLSKNLKSSIKTVSSFKAKSIFITAEDNATFNIPEHRLYLKQQHSSKLIIQLCLRNTF